jgi:ubiquinone/menaquinone biosynthesis C-methylase UbiE
MKKAEFRFTDSPPLRESDAGHYEQYLGVPVESLSKQKVLNIGSGRTGLFEKEAKNNGAEVITISPYFGKTGVDAEDVRRAYTHKPLKERFRKLFKEDEAGKIQPIAARAESMPFQDGSFDTVTALYSVPLYLEPAKKISLFSETARVLKEGGEGTFYPIPEEDKQTFEHELRKKKILFKFSPVQENDRGVVYPDTTSYRLTIRK